MWALRLEIFGFIDMTELKQVIARLWALAYYCDLTFTAAVLYPQEHKFNNIQSKNKIKKESYHFQYMYGKRI